MKKILIGISIILLLILGVWIYRSYATKKGSTPTTTDTVVFPGANGVNSNGGATTPKLSIKSDSGNEILVNNFLASSVAQADPDNEGYYNLGAILTENAPYRITYISATSYFNIGILEEPLGSTRVQAETYLMNVLGISQQEMCSLKYSVSVPNDVNSVYSGMNLGFSFCPHAVKLP